MQIKQHNEAVQHREVNNEILNMCAPETLRSRADRGVPLCAERPVSSRPAH
jgi:hypothetical protein